MKIFAANWKLHKSPSETTEFFKNFLSKMPSDASNKSQIVFFPPVICLEATSRVLNGSKVSWGAQNSYYESKGAFTGETSASVVQSLGAKYILIGHSERRSIFKETDEWIAKKVHHVQSLGLTPMLCIGETLGEREAEQTFEVIERQLQEGLKSADANKPLVVAYEPVWAIGTGRVASIDQVEEAHDCVDRNLKRLGFSDTPILYGGSVKADNAKDLIRVPHVDGFLVGGASLEVDSFLAICSCI